MLIVYRRATGEVVDNSGTNSAMPEGPGDEQAFVNTDDRGLARAGLALLRLHDVDDVEQVELALTRQVKVADGRLVDVGPLPDPPPALAEEPAEEPAAQLLARIEELEARLAAGQEPPS